jgi:hypothetical protein
LKKIFLQLPERRKYFLLTVLGLIVTLSGGWYLFRQMRRPVSLAGLVPASAIGYVEVADLMGLIEQLGRTRAWREIAPVFGVEGRLIPPGLTGWSAWLAGLTIGRGELALVADAHWGIVLTAIEVSGDEVRPRLALLIETSRNPESFQEPVRRLLERMVGALPGQVEPREERHAGVTITGYYGHGSPDALPGALPERGLFVAQVEGGWIISNHIEPMRSCLDARLGRIPTMAGNFYWQQARRKLSRPSYLARLAGGDDIGKVEGLFGFVTGDGVTRLLRSGAHILAGGTVASAILAGAAGDVVTDLSSRFCDGLTLHERVDGDAVHTGYTVMLKPDLIDTLQSIIKPAAMATAEPLRSAALLPPGTLEWIVYRLRSPGPTVSGIEAALSSRIGVAQSFLLHQFVIGAREVFPGIRDEALANAAFGDEMVTARVGEGEDDHLWLLEIRDRTAISRLIDDYFEVAGGVAPRREMIGGFDLIVAGDEARGGAVVIGDFLAIGPPAILRRLIGTQGQSQDQLQADSGATVQRRDGAAVTPDHKVLISGYVRPDAEVIETMLGLSKDTGNYQYSTSPQATSPQAKSPQAKSPQASGEDTTGAVDERIATGRRLAAALPYAVRKTSLESNGVVIESRSPLGHLPFVVGILTGLNGKTDQKEARDEQ